MKTETIHDGDGSSTETDFDNSGNQVETRDFGENGELLRKIKYNYSDIMELVGWDEYNKLSLVRLYKIESTDGSEFVNVYDSHGVLIESTPL